MRQDLLIALDNCYGRGIKVQSMQLLTWILSTLLLTSADESCPNTAPWSLLFSLSAGVERGSEALHSSSELTSSAISALFSCCQTAPMHDSRNRWSYTALFSCCHSPSHCVVQFFRVRAYIILWKIAQNSEQNPYKHI